MLAFTTVALGGFRGLISNALWMRANDLQDDDKFFEMAQLADWITKLEPHYVAGLGRTRPGTWPTTFRSSSRIAPDRWRWVKRGIELLRDEGLTLQSERSADLPRTRLDFPAQDGRKTSTMPTMYYKQQWANEMATVFATNKPNLNELINPQTADQTNRARLLIEKYKMDPKVMKEVDEKYGPLEWRLPEAHAIYWAAPKDWKWRRRIRPR